MENEINRDFVVKKTKNVFITTMVLIAISMITSCENDTNSPNHPKQNPNAVAVDLGLSVKWANCNVGATKPEEYGDYFAWGETTPKEEYKWSTYKHMQSGKNSWEYGGEYITKYTYPDNQKDGIWYNGDTFIGDNKTSLELADDAAHVNWGGNWRMPTKTEQDELRNNCTWTWTTQNGVNGYLVKSKKNSNSIFLPASGFRLNSSLYNFGSYGCFWSSSLDNGGSSYACCLYFGSDYVGWNGSRRYYGQSVRPVCK